MATIKAGLIIDAALQAGLFPKASGSELKFYSKDHGTFAKQPCIAIQNFGKAAFELYQKDGTSKEIREVWLVNITTDLPGTKRGPFNKVKNELYYKNVSQMIDLDAENPMALIKAVINLIKPEAKAKSEETDTNTEPDRQVG